MVAFHSQVLLESLDLSSSESAAVDKAVIFERFLF